MCHEYSSFRCDFLLLIIYRFVLPIGEYYKKFPFVITVAPNTPGWELLTQFYGVGRAFIGA